MAYLEKPKGYWHWFKQALRMCFPMEQDFYGLGDALWEATCALTNSSLKIVVRLLLLLTLPVSVPVITILFKRRNKRVMEHRAKRLSEEWDGVPPMYTKEQVEAVLRGETTQEELDAEQERNFYKH